jgi:protein-tyrosine phosphatase
MNRKRILFVCSRNKWRSKTAETIFKNSEESIVKSAGTSKSAEIKISKNLIDWADEIYVMERKHKDIIEKKYGRIKDKLTILNIPDDYQYMDEELISELRAMVNIK